MNILARAVLLASFGLAVNSVAYAACPTINAYIKPAGGWSEGGLTNITKGVLEGPDKNGYLQLQLRESDRDGVTLRKREPLG